ncbi:putative nuclease of restriction endonuclease-like (RecB) superfamily [Kitasatospora sp. MAP12-15]|uniref:PDDEXK nuclease domain-containing protein n=1 Tax=unclassified Kitasatospora TaxID=2633591 RepID=UPI0024765759|nr:PDDEXK nuclease domain-containing protein [Kitasatospora sp. MAP12-44]MDH6110853.1 putative nuclease of restriction endonuclease-like (RecB) superfamily [Kitasatospora sp. MAP12-44]
MTEELDTTARIPAQEGGDQPTGYVDLLQDITSEIATAQTRVHRAVNTELISHYWRIGSIILDRRQREGWGAKVVEQLSVDLRTNLPGQRGYSRRSLIYMQKTAASWPEGIERQAVSQLPWGHVMILLDSLKDRPTRDFYARQAVQNGWSRNVLVHHIETGLHLRQGMALTNFDATVPEGSDLLKEILKDPYQLDFTRLGTDHAEQDLETALVEHIVRFLQELGVGFAFVGRQYQLQVGSQEFRLDLLFYHLRLHRYIVIELKIGRAEPEHLGKLGFYTAVVDDKIRDPERDDPTLGILIAAHRDEEVVQYSLRSSSQPLAVTTYQTLPAEFRPLLPTPEQLSRVTQEVLAKHSTATGAE